MYTAISLWIFGSPAQANEAIRRLRDDFGPLVRQQPGLRHWFTIATGADEAATVSVWDNRALYDAAQPHLADWAQQHFGDIEARVLHRRRGDIAAYETYRAPDTAVGGEAAAGAEIDGL